MTRREVERLAKAFCALIYCEFGPEGLSVITQLQEQGIERGIQDFCDANQYMIWAGEIALGWTGYENTDEQNILIVEAWKLAAQVGYEPFKIEIGEV